MEEKTEVAVLGGGCFWCTEAVFKMIRGVASVEPGYAGGTKEHPTYIEVSSGVTGYAEVIRIEFDPAVIDFKDLLTVFFGTHDPTTLNRQGNDVGTQYRSAIFYTTEGQKAEAEEFIANINASSEKGAPIVTEVVPLEKFHSAEEYHHDYYSKNPASGYCQVIINPKLDKVQHAFAGLLKNK